VTPAGESRGSANRAPASELSGSLNRSPSGDFQGSAPSGDDEYNFNWLDPEKKIYVLQNRRYVKAKRLMLSVMGGPGFSAPYRSTFNLDPRMAYYFTESWGVEVFFRQTFNFENNTFAALQQASGSSVIPVVRELRSSYGGMVHWVPWYAKINVFNKILYFDWYFGAGVGGIRAAIDKRANALAPANYVSQDLIAGFVSTGHQYSISHHVLVRLDVTAAYYRAPVFGDTGDNATYSNYDFGVGIGFRL
jgi:outer membrane beta-barrel protein